MSIDLNISLFELKPSTRSYSHSTKEVISRLSPSPERTLWQDLLERFKVLGELEEVIAEHQEIANSGYDESPIPEETIKNARRFLNSIPANIKIPSIGTDAQGDITFEWYSSPKNLLSLSIDADSQFFFAGFEKGQGFDGAGIFENTFPELCADIIISICLIKNS